MCNHPHSFKDVYEGEEDRTRLLEDLRLAGQMLGEYALNEAGEAVMVYRMCTKTYRNEAEEKRVNDAIQHYWDGITVRMFAGGFESAADDQVTFDHVMACLTAVDRKVVELRGPRTGEDGIQLLRATFDAGAQGGKEALARSFTGLAESAVN